MTGLDLSALPDLPQRPLLADLARGTGDACSDVDVRVALALPADVTEEIPPASGSRWKRGTTAARRTG